MKVSTFLIGLTLILIGEILFLKNLGYGYWMFSRDITKYWPVLLILYGVVIFRGNWIPRWFALVVLVVLLVGVLVLAMFSSGFLFYNKYFEGYL